MRVLIGITLILVALALGVLTFALGSAFNGLSLLALLALGVGAALAYRGVTRG